MKKFFFIFFILLNSCATITGPSVTEEEILEMQEELKTKAIGYQLRQMQRINDIGYRLISSIPQEDLKEFTLKPYLGIYVFDINKYLKRLYNLSEDKGVVVGIVIDNSPAKKAGIQPADVILKINFQRINNSVDFYNNVRRLKIGQKINFEILRLSKKENILLEAGSIPLDIPINIVDIQEVNAAATSGGIFVTYGLMHFVKSDDELAAVLAHELAHIVRGHITKAQGVSLLSLLLSLPLGIFVESQAPGAGRMVMDIADIFKATYSRDLEREADYFGTKYVYLAGFDVETSATFMERFAIEIPQSMIKNYLSTHPSSPERTLRIRKIISELKNK
ncbi:MAG: M48 family metalloprotease [Candidatus Omnitrophica bacterium]|nr:M48 family metalloprotease [Candidatus Omnitrophota bacterium]